MCKHSSHKNENSSSFIYPHVIPILYDTIFAAPTYFIGLLEWIVSKYWLIFWSVSHTKLLYNFKRLGI